MQVPTNAMIKITAMVTRFTLNAQITASSSTTETRRMTGYRINNSNMTIHNYKQGNHRLQFARAVHSRHPFLPIGDVAYHQHAGGTEPWT